MLQGQRDLSTVAHAAAELAPLIDSHNGVIYLPTASRRWLEAAVELCDARWAAIWIGCIMAKAGRQCAVDAARC